MPANTVPGITEKEIDLINDKIRIGRDAALYFLLHGGNVDENDRRCNVPKHTTNAIMRYIGFYGNRGSENHGPTYIQQMRQQLTDQDIANAWGNYASQLSRQMGQSVGNRLVANPSFKAYLNQYSLNKQQAMSRPQAAPVQPQSQPQRPEPAYRPRPQVSQPQNDTDTPPDTMMLVVMAAVGLIILAVIAYFALPPLWHFVKKYIIWIIGILVVYFGYRLYTNSRR